MTELFLKYLSWPGSIVLVVLAIVLVLRKPLSEVVRRGGLRIGKEGLSIDQAAVAAAVTVQSEAKPIDSTLGLDPETEQRRSQVKQVAISVVVQGQQARIRAELDKLKLTDNKDEAIEVLIQHLAVAQLFHAAEKVYRTILVAKLLFLNI